MSARILLVDDEVELVKMLARFLKAGGFEQVDILHTPEAAVEHIEKNRPDFVFLDINLNASMTGLDVLRRVRQTSPETMVCMSSAYREDYEEASLALGAGWFLKKPATIDDLLSIVRSVER